MITDPFIGQAKPAPWKERSKCWLFNAWFFQELIDGFENDWVANHFAAGAPSH
jgi:hypothetical protein